jgi:hypothetical protein
VTRGPRMPVLSMSQGSQYSALDVVDGNYRPVLPSVEGYQVEHGHGSLTYYSWMSSMPASMPPTLS